MGLVMWNLCRRGIECNPTSQNSHEGDLWARLPDGGMIRIEVNASTETAWHIRRGQISGADCFVLVSIHDARYWVLTQAEVAVPMASCTQRGDVVVIGRAKLPQHALDNWGSLSPAKPKMPRAYRSERVVRKVLADGTIEVYRCPPTTMTTGS